MKSIANTIFVLFIFITIGCDSQNEKTKEVLDVTENHTDKADSPTSVAHHVIGKWNADAEIAGAQMVVEFNEDGTYWQEMAGQKLEGTWEEIDENNIKINNEHLKNGQIWKLTEKDAGNMKVVWSIKTGFSKTPIPFAKEI